MPDRMKLVTGYIPIQGHPRSAKQYGELGEGLFGKLDCKGYVIQPFYEHVQGTWLWKAIGKLPYEVTHSAGDNPPKNSLAYHCVQHQKFGWLLKAAILDPKPSTFVWMDYGIGHVPGVTPAVVNDFMASVRDGDFAIPGCWTKLGLMINDFFPCWRFCGGVMVIPRELVHKVYREIKKATLDHIDKTRNVSWEVNDMARAEDHWPAVRWYSADHNETLFTHYAKDLHK